MEAAAVAGLVANIIEEEEEENEEVMMLARVAAIEIVALEEGEDFGDLDGALWVPVTVVINDYHVLGDPCFKIHFRMCRAVFETLTITIANHLIAKGRLRRQRTPLQDVLLMVVWLLATPDTFRSVALRFGVNPGTLYYFYLYVIEALRELAPQFISWPNAAERVTIKNRFERATGFPGIIGCIDGTHVTVTAPLVDPAQYTNRHHQYSMNVQAVVDSTLLIRDLHVGEVGSMHDNRVFRRSPLQRNLIRSPPGLLIDPDEHLAGDGAYTQSEFMMVPFPNTGHLTPEQVNFNIRLSQARVRVENAFARCKGKWRRLKFLHARNPAVVVDHITAAFVLHNFTILNGEPAMDEEELQRPIGLHEIDENEGHGGEVDDGDEDAEILEEAYARGVEKRLHYMHHVLPPRA